MARKFKKHKEIKKLLSCATCYPWLNKKWRERNLSRRDQQNRDKNDRED